MAASFVIIQYVPDPVIDERINIGVICFDENRSVCEFLSDWRRAKSFGAQDVRFLKVFADQIMEASSENRVIEGLPGDFRLNKSVLAQMAQEYANSIQLTEPRESLLDLEQLMKRIAPRYLRHYAPHKASWQSRRTVARIGGETIARVIEEQFGAKMVDHYLARHKEIPGTLEPHKVDVAIRNGSLRAISQAISFEGPDSMDRDDTISKTAYALRDIMNNQPDLEVSVMVTVPKRRSKDYDRAQQLFPRMGAQLVPVDRIRDWAVEVVRTLPRPENDLTE